MTHINSKLPTYSESRKCYTLFDGATIRKSRTVRGGWIVRLPGDDMRFLHADEYGRPREWDDPAEALEAYREAVEKRKIANKSRKLHI